MNSQENPIISDNILAIVLRYDPQLRLEYSSPEAQAIIPESVRASWDARVGEVFRSGQPQQLDFELPASAPVRTFRLKLLPEVGPDGGVHRVSAIVVETTAAGAPTVSESEERFRIMADCCPALIWVTNAEGGAQFLNLRYRQYANASSEKMNGYNWQPLIHPEDAPTYVGAFMVSVRDRMPFRGEARLRKGDGAWRWVSSFAEPRFSSSGEFLGHVGITLDIDDHKQAEERTRESEEGFRSLFENMQEGFAFCRMVCEPGMAPDFVYLAVNDAFEELTGLENAAGRKVSELIPGIQQSNPELFEIYGRVASTGKPERFETLVPRMGRWFSISAYCPSKDHFIAIFNNITERKKVEEALRDSNRRLEFAIAAGHLGVFEWGIQPNATVWNDTMYELYGISKDSSPATQATWLACLHPDDRARAIENARATTINGRNFSHDYRVVHPDGTIKHIKVDALVIRDANGKPTQLIGLNRDITESKLAVARLEESEKRFRQVVEGVPEGIFVQVDGFIRYINPAGLAIYGAETEALLIDQPFMERVHPDHQDGVAERYRILKEGGKPAPLLELQHLRVDGTAFDLEVTAAPINFEGSEGSVVFFRDISDRKRAEEERRKLEEQFRQAQKMESVGRLAGGISHDFNNLLTVINGYADLLSRALKDGDPLKDFVKEIGKAGEKAAGLTRQLLAFSRKQLLMPKPFDLGSLVVENRDMLRRLLGEDIELVTDLAPDLGQVMADPGQIHQVLMNLVVNARDAMHNGGTLTIRTVNAEQQVLLSVSDNGAGIEKGIHDRIFDPFFTTKSEGEGTGLGLSTVYGIVQQCGGSISLKSEPGQGASFTISLPRISLADGADECAESDRGNLRGKETVLVVEDQEPVRKLVARTLKAYGYHVLEAEQGAAALRMAEGNSEPIHLVVTDVVMPHMTGSELAQHLQRVHPEIKVLFMSGYGTDHIARHGVLNHGAQFIGKPFSGDALAAKVRETLAKDSPGPRP